jgi:hypothetical protein
LFCLLIRHQDRTWRYFAIDTSCDVTLAIANNLGTKEVAMVFMIAAVKSVERWSDVILVAVSVITQNDVKV